jgi:hypothetical protein
MRHGRGRISCTCRRGTGPVLLRCAFWLVFRLLNAGDLPSASGWIARIERLLPDAADGLPERGHLTYLTGVPGHLVAGSANGGG